jgi:hypothetical protein
VLFNDDSIFTDCVLPGFDAAKSRGWLPTFEGKQLPQYLAPIFIFFVFIL